MIHQRGFWRRLNRDLCLRDLPTTSEVDALIIGDIDGSNSRDIVLDTQSRHIQHINEFHPQYLSLQYPLLFPYAKDGFRLYILHRGVDEPDSKGRIKMTMRKFFAYPNEISLILRSRNSSNSFWLIPINWLKTSSLIIYDASMMGNCIIIPSSFTGDNRYMQQNYLVAMTLVKWFGYLDIF
uniref:Uncharacterized protein n=1 Tax=Lactuca sativa TaxID=4236 RepID=A0A9R1VCM5_LACSA|nr:hypothetical protein LSAT_V11C500296740 [Lactuca sativa]